MMNGKIELTALMDITEVRDKKKVVLFKNCRQKFIEEKSNIKLSQCISSKTGKPFKTQSVVFRKDEKEMVYVVGNYDDLKKKIYGTIDTMGFKV